jgi:hypothetical protein
MIVRTNIPITRPPRRWRAGLTFLEFLLAISITAITAIAVGAVTSSIARGMTSMNDTRSALQRALVAHSRLQAQLIPTFCVLDFDPDRGIAVWKNDDRANNLLNLSEVAVLWFDPAGSGDLTLEWVTFPIDWDETTLADADIILTSVDDYFVTMTTQRALGYTTSKVVADGIAAISIEGSGDDLPSSERIRLDLTVGVGEDAEQLLMAFGLVNHRTPQ